MRTCGRIVCSWILHGILKNPGLHVPHVYCVSEDGFCYLQDDLGPDMLLDVVEREREGNF